MNVLLSLEIGGLEQLVITLLKGLAKGQHQMSLCSLSKGGKLKEDCERLGIPVYEVEKRDGIDYLLPFRLARLFKSSGVDLVHTHNSTPWLYAGFGAKIARLKLVHTQHSVLPPHAKKLLAIETLISKITSMVIADCKDVEKSMIEKQGVCAQKIQTIENCIDIDKFQISDNFNKKREEVGVCDKDYIIGTVARLSPEKDHFTMLKAFSKVLKVIPNVSLVIVGDGPLYDILQRKSAELNLTSKVIFMGSRMDVPEIIQLFDIFLLSSVSEGMPLVLLEAMAAGKPIVSTNVGGIPEVVVDGKTGILTPAGDAGEFATAIITLFEDKQLSSFMAKNGQKRVMEHFNLDSMIRAYDAVYCSVVK